MKHSRFVKNAAILTVTSLILRTVGIFFRIYLSGKIGAEGMGLYQLILSIYVLGSTFATSGISTAVTRLVADELVCGNARSVRRILRRSILLSLLIGIASTLLIFFGARIISVYWLKDIRAVPALKMLSFSLPSMGVSSCLRGYFIARRRVEGTSRAQLLEQVVRIAVIMLFIDRFAVFGLATACLAVMIGDTVAEWTSCGYIAIGYVRDKRRLQQQIAHRDGNPPRKSVVKQLLSIAAPITAGRYLNTTLRTVENILVPQSIARFCGSKESGLSQFGALKGMALPLIFFPASFLSAMSTLLIPEISSANAEHRQDRIRFSIEKALHVTFTASILIGAVFTVFSRQLGQLLYHNDEVGIYLRVLAPLTPIMYAESIVDGILKGLNQQVSSLKYSVTDSAVRIVLIFALVPYYGMGGFLFIMVISNLLTSFLNLNRLLTVTNMKIRWKQWILGPLFCGVTAAVLILPLNTWLSLSSLSPLVITIIGGMMMGVVYVLSLWGIGCTPAFGSKTENRVIFQKI